MLTPKENFLLAAVEHKKPEWVPNEMSDVIMYGGAFESFKTVQPAVVWTALG